MHALQYVILRGTDEDFCYSVGLRFLDAMVVLGVDIWDKVQMLQAYLTLLDN